MPRNEPRSRPHKLRDRLTAVLASAGAIAVTSGFMMMAATGTARADSPNANDKPGNNGTVKVAGVGDVDTTPDNEPHLPCTFTVQWYDFGAPKQGEDPFVGTVDFELQAPTNDDEHSLTVVSGDTTKLIEQDEPSGAGNDFDGEEVYTLSFTGEPHMAGQNPDKQGFHVKITVTTPDSKGNDTKHKVFWVGPCEEEPPPPTDACPNLPGDQPEGTDCTPPSSPTDACPNLPGDQPEGTDCTPPSSPTDACPNLPGDQPEGTDCTPPTSGSPGPEVDVCPNIPGDQAELPDGFVQKPNGTCVPEPEVKGTESASPTPDERPTVKGTEAVPTAVDAGLPGGPAGQSLATQSGLLAQALVAGGLALLMAAGWLQLGRLTHGAHQA